MSDLKIGNRIVDISSPANHLDSKPSMIEQIILNVNEDVTKVKRLYKLTDETGVKAQKSGMWEAVKEKDEKQASGAGKIIKLYEEYIKDARAIDERGGSKWSFFKEYFASHRHFIKSRRVGAYDSGGDYIEKSRKIMESYERLAEDFPFTSRGFDDGITDKLIQFSNCICDQNKTQFLMLAVQLDKNIEGLKQLRDMKMAEHIARDSQTVETRPDTKQLRRERRQVVRGMPQVYSYNDHNDFVFLDENGQVKRKIGDLQENESHLQHIQAAHEMEQRFDASGVSEVMSTDTLFKYINFNQGEFDKMVAAAQVQDLQRLSQTEGRSESDQSVDSTQMNMILDALLDNKGLIAGSAGAPFDAIYEKLLPLCGLEECGQAREAMKDLAADPTKYMEQMCAEGGLSAISFIANAASTCLYLYDAVEICKRIHHCRKSGDITGANTAGAELGQKLGRALLSFAKTGMNGVRVVTDFLAASGIITSTQASIAITASSYVGGAATILTGSLDALMGGYRTATGAVAYKKADHAKHRLREMENNGSIDKDSRRLGMAKRLVNQRRIVAEKQTTEGAVDVVTGVIRAIGGAIAMVPIPIVSVIGTGVGLVGTGLNLLAKKLIISKVFKNKAVNQAWSEVLKYSNVKEYTAAIDKMGHRGDARFHDILRRKTGIATRTNFAAALKITDAIDMYTSAKVYGASRVLHRGSDFEMIKTAMRGLGYNDPDKYSRIRLEDLLGKVDADKDWRAGLRKAITDNTFYNLKDDMSTKRIQEVLSGKYDG
ncbi:MAG: hypothetical protein IJ512_03600 [Ruminococcus sp.]|nr:hypothetical protein [Ruminococcus sp.]